MIKLQKTQYALKKKYSLPPSLPPSLKTSLNNLWNTYLSTIANLNTFEHLQNIRSTFTQDLRLRVNYNIYLFFNEVCLAHKEQIMDMNVLFD
jgi:hypothetical protein